LDCTKKRPNQHSCECGANFRSLKVRPLTERRRGSDERDRVSPRLPAELARSGPSHGLNRSIHLGTSLARHLPDEFHRTLNPPLQLAVVLDAFGCDQHPILHRLAGNLERLDVRFQQRFLALLVAKPDDIAGLFPPHHGEPRLRPTLGESELLEIRDNLEA
jgi:hypothetical protein